MLRRVIYSYVERKILLLAVADFVGGLPRFFTVEVGVGRYLPAMDAVEFVYRWKSDRFEMEKLICCEMCINY